MPLPLKVRLAIRQAWDDPSSPSQKALQALSDTLGRPIACDPDWDVLHAVLSPLYASDAAQLVSDTTGYIQSWARAAHDVLQDDDALADNLLEAMAQRGARTLPLAIQVSPSDPQTRWDSQRAGFELLVPREPRQHPTTAAVPAFRAQITSALHAKTPPDAADGDEWADLAVPAAAATVPVSPGLDDTEPAYLPDVNTLPRPDELLLRPPYHLHIAQASAITVQCSHSPSLSFLEAYFKKWCRTNNQLTNRPPMVYVTLSQSPFGLGPLYDTLTLEVPRDHHRASGLPPQLSIPIVLHLVESVLGYTRVFSDASGWQYRRDTPLRSI
ncbi:uncharacterized protein G6M90_00g083370 [Metarhizium brunneum]|uniref:Uncharacterized protein n=1 Tax=Metarhizium brunneum TaxID=500148 RepID=A0A7D5YY51_9HYPO|nr:hypothetical protein G6M90_00g083370 [Metarhizium brunneum]